MTGRLRFCLLASAGLAVLVAGPVFAAGSVIAKKDNVPVLAAPSAGAKVIKTLKKDEDIPANERKGMFWEVKVGAQTGYVSMMAVNRKADGPASSLSKAIRAAAQEGRDTEASASARSRSAVMGVRGLSESDKTANAGNVPPNLRLVYQMEDRQVSRKNLDALASAVNSEIEKKVRTQAAK